MVERSSFVGNQIDLKEYAFHHLDIENALKLYFGDAAEFAGTRFVGYTKSELEKELSVRLIEVEIQSSMT